MAEKPLPSALATRIKEACQRSGLSESEIARRLGASRGAVNHWTQGKAVPTAALLGELIRVTRVNGHWLLTGEGTPDLYIVASAGIIAPEPARVETPTPSNVRMSRVTGRR